MKCKVIYNNIWVMLKCLMWKGRCGFLNDLGFLDSFFVEWKEI